MKKESLDSYDYYVINMTSQTWLSAADTDRSVWWHWIQIIVPTDIDLSLGNIATMYINGGSNTDGVPTQPDPVVALFATAMRHIAVELNMIPNQPTNFFFPGGESGGTQEDGLIAYTWAHFLNDTTQPFWLARLPMVKAAVRALDTLTAFIPTLNISGLSSVDKVCSSLSLCELYERESSIIDAKHALLLPANATPRLDADLRQTSSLFCSRQCLIFAP